MIVQAGSPNKKVYHLTDNGRVELQDWVREPILDIPALDYAIEYTKFEVAWFEKMVKRVDANQNPENAGIEQWANLDE